MSFKVLIAGAGLGGLAAMRALPYTGMINRDLTLKRRIAIDTYRHTEHHVAAGLATHVNVDRAILRQILLTGLDEICHYGNPVTSYDSCATGVTAVLADATKASGHVLVGADGIRSAIRRQRAPYAQTIDTGAMHLRSPSRSKRSPTHARARCGRRLQLQYRRAERASRIGRRDLPDGAICCLAGYLFPSANLPPRDDYVACIVAARQRFFENDDDEMRKLGSKSLQDAAVRLIADWPDEAKAVVAAGEPDEFFYVEMYSSIPSKLGSPRNVTLIGDAAHAMSPSLGRGANVALRDAAHLGRQLIAVANGEIALVEALKFYENEMLEHGFDVVRDAAKKGTMVIGQHPLPE